MNLTLEDAIGAVVRKVIRDEVPGLVREAVRAELGNNTTCDEGWLSISAAAEYADCSTAYLRRKAKGGELEAKRAGRSWRTTREAVDRLLEGDPAKKATINLDQQAAVLLARGRGMKVVGARQ